MVEQTEHVENIPKSEQPFAKCAFGDERLRLARVFTNYFDRTVSTSGYVANLNGEWGTGKTFFVTEWANQLKTEHYGVVFIDAWKSDYLNDPLSIVVAEVLQQLTEQLKTTFGVHDTQQLTNGILKTSGGLIKAFLPVLTKAIGNRVLGEESVELLVEFIGGTKEFLDQDNPKSLNTRLGEFGQLAFSAHQRHCQFANDFKNELQKLIDLIVNKSNKNKIYIFIDELDRCRPTYAIEMLETIKHLFDIKNLVFIISTDTAQLEHSIKAVYGNGFDSFEYLHRFFKQRITLPKPDYYKFLCMANAFDGVDFNAHHYYPKIDSSKKLRALVSLQAETNQIELRKLENIQSQIELFLSEQDNQSNLVIDMTYLVAAIFTINLHSEPDSNPLMSVHDGITINDVKFKTKKIPLGLDQFGAQDKSFIEFVNFLIGKYTLIDTQASLTQEQNHWDLFNPHEKAPADLCQGLSNGQLFNYLSSLKDNISHQKLILIKHDEVYMKIKKLNINKIFEK